MRKNSRNRKALYFTRIKTHSNNIKAAYKSDIQFCNCQQSFNSYCLQTWRVWPTLFYIIWLPDSGMITSRTTRLSVQNPNASKPSSEPNQRNNRTTKKKINEKKSTNLSSPIFYLYIIFLRNIFFEAFQSKFCSVHKKFNFLNTISLQSKLGSI